MIKTMLCAIPRLVIKSTHGGSGGGMQGKESKSKSRVSNSSSETKSCLHHEGHDPMPSVRLQIIGWCPQGFTAGCCWGQTGCQWWCWQLGFGEGVSLLFTPVIMVLCPWTHWTSWRPILSIHMAYLLSHDLGSFWGIHLSQIRICRELLIFHSELLKSLVTVCELV